MDGEELEVEVEVVSFLDDVEVAGAWEVGVREFGVEEWEADEEELEVEVRVVAVDTSLSYSTLKLLKSM